MQKYAKTQQMIPMAAWAEPKRGNKTHGKHKQQENMTRGRWGNEMRAKYRTTWAIPGGETRRQVDYIAINEKYRNTARKAHSNIYWRANMNQNQQHRSQTMQRYYNAAKKYKTPTPPDTLGGELKYDIRELRLRPEKLAKWYQEQEQDQGGNKRETRG